MFLWQILGSCQISAYGGRHLIFSLLLRWWSLVKGGFLFSNNIFNNRENHKKMLCLGNESVIVQIECFNIFKDFQFVFIPLTFTLKWFILIPQESNYHNFHWNQFSFCSIFCIIICYPFTYQCLWMKQQVPSPLSMPPHLQHHEGIV